MSTLHDKASKTIDLLSTALHGLDTIGELAKVAGASSNGSDKALEVLKLIETVVDSIKAGFDGTADATAINEGITKLRADMLAGDAEDATELDKKFPR